VPALVRGMKRHMAETNPLADHPTTRILRFALLELEEMANYGGEAVKCLVSGEQQKAMQPWKNLLAGLLKAAGDMDGSQPMVAALRRVMAHLMKELLAHRGRLAKAVPKPPRNQSRLHPLP